MCSTHAQTVSPSLRCPHVPIPSPVPGWEEVGSLCWTNLRFFLWVLNQCPASGTSASVLVPTSPCPPICHGLCGSSCPPLPLPTPGPAFHQSRDWPHQFGSFGPLKQQKSARSDLCRKGGRFLIKTGPPSTWAQQFGLLLKHMFLCLFGEYLFHLFSVVKAHLCVVWLSSAGSMPSCLKQLRFITTGENKSPVINRIASSSSHVKP